MNGRHLTAWAAIGGVALLMASAPLAAQKIERTTARPIASIEGVDTFNAYCAVCHGPGAKGNGPAAKALAKTPADLTTIARRHGGKFSLADVETVIVGKDDMLAHGTREMPMWGPVFRSFNQGDDAVTKLRVANLVNYLKSIQTQ